MATSLSKKESAATKKESTLSKTESALIDAYWRAANYLSVGQIYLFDNPLLREPLKEEHIKPRLLGHWGTTPGLNFVYVHLNRLIKKLDLDMIYVTGPGHGGPGLVANTYLEGTYSEVYPHISQDAEGMKRLFTQFSFPGGIPSHVAPETPGSIHEGGELGYALSHAYGAAFDNPDLIVAAWSATAKRRRGPWPRAGIPTSSSIRSVTAPSCRSCISTATRSPTRRCWRASAMRSSNRFFAATDTSPISSRGMSRVRCTSSWRRRSKR